MTIAAMVTGLFRPNPYLDDSINHNIIASEIEGGVHLHDIPPGTALDVRTRNRAYTVVYRGGGEALISGHPKYCPEPVPVHITGSTWGGTMLKQSFIGRGMRLEFRHPAYAVITTSPVVEIRAR
jgi:hypothetical protein